MGLSRIIICKECNKEKRNASKGLCDNCYRILRRRSDPNYYLKCTFQNMKTRIKSNRLKWKNYNGLQICDQESFMNKFINDKIFINLYNEWQKSGYKTYLSPSINRINNEKGYTLDNMEFIIQQINSSQRG